MHNWYRRSQTEQLAFREECVGSHHGQTDLKINAYNPQSGKDYGYIDFVIFDGKIHISMVEVFDEYRRRGIATKMVEYMRSQNPGLPIFWGYATGSGAQFIRSLPAETQGSYGAKTQPLVFWHATTPSIGEAIQAKGKIIPLLMMSNAEQRQYQNWNFTHKDQEYGAGVYLAKEHGIAIYYAKLRLKDEWEQVAEGNPDLLLNDEEYGFIGLFKINVLDQSKLQGVNDEYTTRSVEEADELMYLDVIPKQPNPKAWYEGPEWYDVTADLEDYRKRLGF